MRGGAVGVGYVEGGGERGGSCSGARSGGAGGEHVSGGRGGGGHCGGRDGEGVVVSAFVGCDQYRHVAYASLHLKILAQL